MKIKLAALLLSVAAMSARADVNQTLDALHAAGDKLKSLAADVELKTTDKGTGEDRAERGRFVLQRLDDGDTRARITFSEQIVGERLKKVRRDFLLASGRLVEQNETSKKQVTRQVRRPGEKIDLFKLGQGPFPLPIGQPKEAVHEQFDVTAGPADNVVVLTPKKDTALYTKFKRIVVTVDAKLGLPTVIETADPNGVETKVVTLTNLRVNDAVKDEEFTLPAVDPKQWKLVDE